VRSITLFIFGGVSDIKTEPPTAVAEFWIALAGPVTSVALAGFFGFLEPMAGAVAPLAAVTKSLAFVKGILGLFNLVPGFPFSGGRVFRAILRGITHDLQRPTVIAANVGRLLAFSSSRWACGGCSEAMSSTACGSRSSAGSWRARR
jgi:Zn-dependent protease